MPGTDLTPYRDMGEERLAKDLAIVLEGSGYHEVLRTVCAPEKGMMVLEPGCGSGKLGLWYELQGATVFLVDIDAEVLRYAAELHRRVVNKLGRTSTSAVFLKRSIFRLNLTDNTFDFVFNEGVCQIFGFNSHDWRRQKAVNEMVRVTKPGGITCIITDNPCCHIALWKVINRHQRPYHPFELAQRMYKAGLKKDSIVTAPIGESWFEAMRFVAWGKK